MKHRVIHNCHVHLFTIDHLPDKYFPLLPTHTLKKEWGLSLGRVLFQLVRWFMGKDMETKYRAFLSIAKMEHQEAVFDYLRGFYPEETKFAVLSLDFEYMGRGKPKISYIDQLNELVKLKEKYPQNIYPFICVDPRRENIFELVKEYIGKGFCGIKLYPSMGFFVNDPRLTKIYEYAQLMNIPVTAHCIPVNAVYYKGTITSEMINTAAKNLNLNPENINTSNKQFAYYWNHPHNYLPVLKQYPNLKLNLAHFGGNKEWDNYLDESWKSRAGNVKVANWFKIILDDMIKKHDNVYADISFTVYDPYLFPLLKIILQDDKVREHVLFGSDYFMLEKDYTERRFSINVRGYLDEADYWQIAETNPGKFLCNNVKVAYQNVTSEVLR